jgi:hypothetical protein
MLKTNPQVGDKILYKFSGMRKKLPATVRAIEGDSCIFTIDGDEFAETFEMPLWSSNLFDHE